MALAQDNLKTKVVESNVTSTTWTHTCTGSNLVLLVFIGVNYAAAAPTVTYNGVGMTLLGRADTGSRTSAVYFMINPPTGSAYTISVTNIYSGYIKAYSVSITGADQNTPFSAVGTDSYAGSTNNRTVNVVSGLGQMIYSHVCTYGTAGSSSFTSGTGQTEVLDTNTQSYLAATGSSKAGAAGASLIHTCNVSQTEWNTTAISVSPVKTTSTRNIYIAGMSSANSSKNMYLAAPNTNRGIYICGKSSNTVIAGTKTMNSYPTAGQNNFTAVTSSITVRCWGSGGSGGGITTDTGPFQGGGGAGGQFATKSNIVVIPGAVYSAYVGNYSTYSTDNGGSGEDTTFATNVVVAKGGVGGLSYENGGTAGLGSTSGGIGDTVYRGGNGSNGGAGTSGGAGGGGAGTTGNGGDASGITKGSGTGLSGGSGGAGSTTNRAGNNASASGGGGGGACVISGTTDYNGGRGAKGLLEIEYYTYPLERYIYIIGKTTDSSGRGINIAGKAISNSTSNIYFTGKLVNNSTCSIYLTGKTNDYSYEDIYLEGIDTINSENWFDLIGSLPDTSEYEFLLRGIDTTFSVRSIHLEGSITTDNAEEGIYVIGIDTSGSEEFEYLIGELTNDSEKPTYLMGKETDNSEPSIYLSGISTSNSTSEIYLTGVPTTEPSTQAHGITVGGRASGTTNGFHLGFDFTNGNGGGRIVLVREGYNVTIDKPADGTSYPEMTSPQDWSAGIVLGNSKIMFNGTAGGPVLVTGMTPDTDYTVAVYEYNVLTDLPNSINYNTDSAYHNPYDLITRHGGTTDREIDLTGVNCSYRNYYIEGKLTDNSERDFYESGKALDSSEYETYLLGIETLAFNRLIYLEGYETDSSEANIYYEGIATDESSREMYIHGIDQDQSERECYITGSLPDASEKGFYLFGVATTFSVHSMFLASETADESEFEFYLEGIATDFSPKKIYLWGKTIGYLNSGIYIKGVTTGDQERTVRITGKLTNYTARGFYLAGITIGSSDKNIYDWGKTASYTARLTYVWGKNQTNSTRLIYLKGTTTGLSSIPIYLTGKITTGSTRNVYLKGRLISERYITMQGIIRFWNSTDNTPNIFMDSANNAGIAFTNKTPNTNLTFINAFNNSQ